MGPALDNKPYRIAMKTSLPKSTNRRDKLVDTMAKKLADGGNVEKTIVVHRKRRIKTLRYIYLTISISVVSMSITWLVASGNLHIPGVAIKEAPADIAPVKRPVDLLMEDLNEDKIGPDQFARYVQYYLIRYDSLPGRYKVPGAISSSDVYIDALYQIWPRVSLRTRAQLQSAMPFLEKKWERFKGERQN
jgi:hypothetical protein